MRRIPTLIALTVVAAACSSTESGPVTTGGIDDPTTTTTIAHISAREGLVPDPSAIRRAVEDGAVSSLQADTYLAAAMWGVFDTVPLEFMVDPVGLAAAQWDHSATTRLIERWDDLDVLARTRLLGDIDGLDELAEPSNVQSIRSTRVDSCVPVGLSVDVWICDGASIGPQGVPGLPLQEAADVVRPAVRDAARDAWPKFAALLGTQPSLIKVYLSNLHATGGYTYGVVPSVQPEADGSICHVYVDVLLAGDTDESMVHLGDAGVPDGTPLDDQMKATVAHEMFHCFQRAAGVPFDAALWEGSATWSEHHVYPQENTEVPWMTSWVTDPHKPFPARLYDTAFGFLVADQRSGASAVVGALRAGSIAGLAPEAAFFDLWHDVSVTAWNQPPVAVLIDDGATVPGVVEDLGVFEVTAEASETMAFFLPEFSRDIQTFEFSGGTTGQDLEDFARLWLDLSAIPSDVRLSALSETTEGWLAPIPLVGDEWLFCRAAIGPCNDADPATIHPYTRIVLIATNVDNGTERFDLPWDTHNPHLHGIWVRADGPFLTNPGATAPYSIIGTRLEFDEPGFLMTESTDGYSLGRSDAGWECSFAGQYSITADAAYRSLLGGDVDGTVTVTGPGDGETFTNSCTYSPSGGSPTTVSGLHIPVAASPDGTFGFEIRDHDTLWVYAFERIYLYERATRE